ncbi:MAG TPA: hypothetical protein PKA82_06100 [Pyrinomonadaceae bacterium]|nr:hypothetical protein [Pyrinomonadaceae bacterium]
MTKNKGEGKFAFLDEVILMDRPNYLSGLGLRAPGGTIQNVVRIEPSVIESTNVILGPS